jgi:arginine-tRNA-protein transferase
MSTLQTLRFFATPEHECSYLDNEKARTLFVDPQADVDADIYGQLTDMGFRRSGSHIYRPHCIQCDACISIRIPAYEFQMSKSQKRIWNKNRDLSVESIDPALTDEIYKLYERYIKERHSDGDMYPPSPGQFSGFLADSNQQSQFHLMRDAEGKLLAVAVSDSLQQGQSAVYTFYDPEHEHRSLGTYAVLWQLMQLREQRGGYLYLGYWVKNCRKMSYKARFYPLERLEQGVWIPVGDAERQESL